MTVVMRRHKRSAMRFLRSVGKAEFSSPLANKYQKRCQKSGEKMFTFLDHDGVPWNNNNAEHAIKLFAKQSQERGIQNLRVQQLEFENVQVVELAGFEYLVLATVFETCEFNNLNILKFMLSKETTLVGLLSMAGRKPERNFPIELCG